MPTRLYLSPPHLRGEELGFVQEAFASNYIAPLGPMVDAFEREFAAYTGISHCVALASGTAAMHLALRELGVGPGDEVLASTLTFIGSVTPATFLGASVAFLDSDEASWNLDPALLAEELAASARRGKLPKAVIPTDLYGQCCDVERIKSICERYEVPVVCDSAEAMGARYCSKENLKTEIGGERMEDRGQPGEVAGRLHGPGRTVDGGRWTQDGGQNEEPERTLPRSASRTFPSPDETPPAPPIRAEEKEETGGGAGMWRHAGCGGEAAVFSFNGNKIITTSGGGMLASHDKGLIEHARKLSQQAREPASHYEHAEIGYNYRMSNILAAIGRGQLRALDERVARKRQIFERYQAGLANLPGMAFMPEPEGYRSNRWLTVVLIDEREFGATPEQVRLALEAENIESRPVWKPMHLQPVFGHCRVRSAEVGRETGREAVARGHRRTVSERLFARGLCLPSGTAMTEADQQRVMDIMHKVRTSVSKSSGVFLANESRPSAKTGQLLVNSR